VIQLTLMEPTARIAEDTGAWRAEADRILGFWLEHAVASADWGMVCSEVLDAFNDWLVENGHTKWSKETFVTRFLQHSESVRHGIERRQVRTKGRNIWRYGRREFAGHSELKEREWCFLGIRLQTPSDQRRRPEAA
jgi:putative DNA primase/helicase